MPSQPLPRPSGASLATSSCGTPDPVLAPLLPDARGPAIELQRMVQAWADGDAAGVPRETTSRRTRFATTMAVAGFAAAAWLPIAMLAAAAR